jgi:hypothetical protein
MKALHTMGDVSLAPFADRLSAQRELPADRVIVHAISGHQHKAGSEDKTIRQAMRTSNSLQVYTLLFRELYGSSWAALSHGFPP